MLGYLDLTTGLFTASPTIADRNLNITGTVGGDLQIQIQVQNAGSFCQLAAGSSLSFTVKLLNQYTGTTLIAQIPSGSFAAPTTLNGPYIGYLNLNTNAAQALMATNAQSVALMASVDWQQPSDPGPNESQQLGFTLVNRVYNGNELTPTDAGLSLSSRIGNFMALANIAGLTGGGGTHLDGVATTGFATPQFALFLLAGVPRIFVLEAAPQIAIASVSAAAAAVVTTSAAHGLVSGQSVVIAGTAGSTPSVNGTFTATVLSATTFSIPVTTTVAATPATGTAQLAPTSPQLVPPVDYNATTNAKLWVPGM